VTYQFDPGRNHILVSVRITGPTKVAITRMALDTGATRTSLDQEIAAELGYGVDSSTETVRVATGSQFESVPVIGVERIEALGNHKENLPILSKSLPTGLPIDGLLGLDFFRNHRLTIDFREGLITLD